MVFMNQKAHSKRKSNITDNLLGLNTMTSSEPIVYSLDRQGLGNLEVESEVQSVVPSLCAHNRD